MGEVVMVKVGVMVVFVKVRVEDVDDRVVLGDVVGLVVLPEEVDGLVLEVMDDDVGLMLLGDVGRADLVLLMSDDVVGRVLIPEEELKGDVEDSPGPSVGEPSTMLPVAVVFPLGVGSRTKDEVGLVLAPDEELEARAERVGSTTGGPSMFEADADGFPVAVGSTATRAVTPQQEQAEE